MVIFIFIDYIDFYVVKDHLIQMHQKQYHIMKSKKKKTMKLKWTIMFFQ